MLPQKKEVPTQLRWSFPSWAFIHLLPWKPSGLEGAPWVLQTSEQRHAAAPLSRQCVPGRGRGGAGTLTVSSGPRPRGGVSQRPPHQCHHRPRPPGIPADSASDRRAPTSPCLGSVSVKLRARVKHPVPMPEVLVDCTGDFLAYQRLRQRKSVNNAGCSELKPGASALLLGGDSGPRVLVWICSG